MDTSHVFDEQHAAHIGRVAHEGQGRHDAIRRQLSPSQKVAVVHELRRLAWEGKAAWLRERHPGLGEEEIQARLRAIFLRAVTCHARRTGVAHHTIRSTPEPPRPDVHGHGVARNVDLWDPPLHHWAIDRRQATTIDGEIVWLAPPEYVALRKLQYFRDGGSDKHIRDVRAMLRQLGAELDRSVLEREATRLGLQAQLAMVTAQP